MAHLMRIGVYLQFVVIGTIAWIIRRNCFQYADFSYIKENEVLQGSVIATFTGKSQVECETECIEDYRCKSINSENAGQRTCELNSENIMDIIANLTLTSKAGWTYKATNYSELLVGGNCKLLRPCPMNQVCVDSCDCPGYVCHKCRAMKIGIDCLSKIVVEGKALGIESGKIQDYQITGSSYNMYDQQPFFARLNSNDGWCVSPSEININQFIQVNFGRRKIITDIAVQGFKYSDWLTSYLFLYTEDNINWQTYEEDGVNKIFDGATSIHAIVKQNLFYYVRAYSVKLNPRTWVKWICMRIELYGIDDPWQPPVPEVINGHPLGIESRTVKDYQMTASWRTGIRQRAHDGRLNNAGQWCNPKSSQNEYIRVDFYSRKIITDIAIQGHHTHNNWVKTYLLRYTEDSYQWKPYQENGASRVFRGISVLHETKKTRLQHSIRAFAIEINPVSWQDIICLRMELYGIEDPTQPAVPTGCSSSARPLGIASKGIPDNRFTSSGYYSNGFEPHFGRLAGTRDWCEKGGATNTYIQVDLAKKMVVVAVATQGRYKDGDWVKSYQVSYGDTNGHSTWIMDGTNRKIFPGNIDLNGIVKNKFEPPITARYVRINPKDFHGLVCLRMELYGCDMA